MSKKILVTEPLMPSLDNFNNYLHEIWQNKWLTNNGSFHKRLEKKLADYLDVPNLSLFTNGTLALQTALQVLDIKGEVITTPYTFVATSTSLIWNNVKPVFVDIDPVWCNMDCDKIEEAITENTTAILPVHVYGNPCDNSKIQSIADKHGLKVIYDAAHAFGIKQNGQSILNWGDLSILSFHATKTFSTIEGGAIVCHDKATKKKIDLLKNFGFNGETEVIAAGINGKMNEVQAAYGLAALDIIDSAISQRKKISLLYQKQLAGINGIQMMPNPEGVDHNYSYFPIFVNQDKYGKSRDELYLHLKQNEVFGRRYFYPLLTDFEPFNQHPSDHLSIAKTMANQVICLPLHHNMKEEQVEYIVSLIKA
ncbi:DegT/DnrJ/EryC1/StrS family aminotransferase [Carboxylicivirga sp. N1Y90]|uniref:DegT/DnrJ/EryC1/StrS family aminotransferase n=1 Tax=Carboxylicivirga fragile TaxID=3417571 RepID=UPI003D34B263|nr:DegT/DnrJ/EryC1/StrS family aminotransferase [Marinilabiliaceae bacterium N1Y90]